MNSRVKNNPKVSTKKGFLFSPITVIAVILLVVFAIYYEPYDVYSYRYDYLTGWLLLGIILTQFLYYAHKRLKWFRLPNGLPWLQLHTEFGLLAVVVFLIHMGLVLPGGGLSLFLVVVFIAVILTGLLGLYIKKRYQKMVLRRTSREVVAEEIPKLIDTLRQKAEKIMIDCASQRGDSLLVNHFLKHLTAVFVAPQDLLAHLVGSDPKLTKQLGDIEQLIPYLDKSEVQPAKQLMELIRRKNRLDYFYAHDSMLKLWLLIHVPLASVLVLLIVMHIVVIYAFLGGG